MRITTVETDRRIELPEDWVTELGLGDSAMMEKTDEGILIRPRRTLSWDEVFSEKLPLGSASAGLDLDEVTADDVLF
jgi:hypothetical protein